DLVGRDAVLAAPTVRVAVARREVCGRFAPRVHGGDGRPGGRRGLGGDRPRSRPASVDGGGEDQGAPGGQGEAEAGGERHGGLLLARGGRRWQGPGRGSPGPLSVWPDFAPVAPGSLSPECVVWVGLWHRALLSVSGCCVGVWPDFAPVAPGSLSPVCGLSEVLAPRSWVEHYTITLKKSRGSEKISPRPSELAL